MSPVVGLHRQRSQRLRRNQGADVHVGGGYHDKVTIRYGRSMRDDTRSMRRKKQKKSRETEDGEKINRKITSPYN